MPRCYKSGKPTGGEPPGRQRVYAQAPIVNISSSVGSVTRQADPGIEIGSIMAWGMGRRSTGRA
jgi:hypothetical protein